MFADNFSKSFGLCLNEDSNHYYNSRSGRRISVDDLNSFIDQYEGTQVKELLLNVNCMRTSYDSAVWDPVWKGYDPEAGDDQPLFASVPEEGRKKTRAWVHAAWQLKQDGIDIYACWIDRCRKRGISPWISMRMNDIHSVNDENNYLHSNFWKKNPDLRRVRYKFSEWTDRAFDYGRTEVRQYHFKLIEELVERYDFDGLELDWMRFGFHFRPGFEDQGVEILNEFMNDVRSLLDKWEKIRGHKIKLGTRVPSRPQTALGLGMDAIAWARKGYIDMLVVTPFWASIETDINIEIWKQLLKDTGTILAAGLEVIIRGYPQSSFIQMNSIETVRGAAASFLSRGADRIYLFNYMDCDTAMADLDNYQLLLRETGCLETLDRKSRRHVVTYSDTWVPGEARAQRLPQTVAPGSCESFRVHIGPKPEDSAVYIVLGLKQEMPGSGKNLTVRTNGELCGYIQTLGLKKPVPEGIAYCFSVPDGAVKEGYNYIEVISSTEACILWVEMDIRPF